MRTENQNIEEPSLQPVEVFERAEDRTRREWAENSGDWAWQVIKFLQGRRANEINLAEILTTKTYAHATEIEKASLRFVAAQAEQHHPPSEDDRIRLRERDNFLMRYVEGKTLGHQNWVQEIQGIPFAVARAQALDAALFPKTFPSRELFKWVWEAR
jgi:hypothetical protein